MPGERDTPNAMSTGVETLPELTLCVSSEKASPSFIATQSPNSVSLSSLNHSRKSSTGTGVAGSILQANQWKPR